MRYDGSMPVTQRDTEREDAVARVCEIVERLGEVGNDEYKMSIDPRTPEIRVHELRTGRLAAYSSTRADYPQSLAEFAHDYIVVPMLDE